MILSIINTKGGVGKSTLAISLADVLAATGRRVNAVDADPQSSLTDWSLRCQQTQGEVPFNITHFPATEEKPFDPEMWLRKILRSAPSFDITIIDGPPSNPAIQQAIVNASDFVLVPVKPGGMASRAASGIVAQIRAAAAGGKTLQAAIVINDARDRELVTRHMGNVLAQHGMPLADTRIPHLTVFEKMDMLSRPLTALGADAQSARAAIKALIKEMEI